MLIPLTLLSASYQCNMVHLSFDTKTSLIVMNFWLWIHIWERRFFERNTKCYAAVLCGRWNVYQNIVFLMVTTM